MQSPSLFSPFRQLSNIITRAQANQMLRDTSVLSMGTALSQGILIMCIPILSRLYSPGEFGLLAIFTAISTILASMLTLRYETTILLPKVETESYALVGVCVSLVAMLGSLVIIATFILPYKVESALGIAPLGTWLPLAALSGTAAAILATGTAWMNRKKNYAWIAKVRVAQSATIAGLGIIFGMAGLSSGLLVAQIVGLLAGAFLMSAGAMALYKYWSINPLLSAARTYASVPKYLLPTSLLDVITQQLPILLITAWFSQEQAGQFSLAWRVLAMPMALIGGAVGLVFYQRFSQAWPDKNIARALQFKTWKILALIGMLPTIVIMAFGEPIFTWLFGLQWEHAGRMAAIMAPMLFVIFVSSPTTANAIVVGALPMCMRLDIFVVIYRIICFVGFSRLSLEIALSAWSIGEIAFIILRNFLVLRLMK